MKQRNYTWTNFIFELIVTIAILLTGCASKQTSSVEDSTNEPVATETAEVEETDTTGPVITLAKETITATAGTKLSKLDVSDAIKEVKDDVDGEISKVEALEDGEAGYVLDFNSVKTDDKKLVKGTYSIKVTAQDVAGNKTTESIELKVKAAESASTKSSTKSTNTKKTTTTASKKSSTTSNKTTASTSKSNAQKNSSTSAGKAAATNNSSSSNKSNASNGSAATQQKSCKNVHHDATGHYETVVTGQKWVQDSAAWDEQVKSGEVVICNGCGTQFGSQAEWSSHATEYGVGYDDWSHGAYHVQSTYSTVHHEATGHYENTTEQKWVQDTAAYDETVCS